MTVPRGCRCAANPANRAVRSLEVERLSELIFPQLKRSVLFFLQLDGLPGEVEILRVGLRVTDVPRKIERECRSMRHWTT